MQEKSFETLYQEYIDISELLNNENLDLERSLTLYKESKAIYSQLMTILENAKLQVEKLEL